jgi:ribonuclease P protein component
MKKINDHDNELKKNEMISKSETIKKIVGKGYFFKQTYMRMYFIHTPNDNLSKIIIIVTKKKIKKSFERKKIKRLIKEAYRLNKFLINEIYNFIFISNKLYKYYKIKKEMINFLSSL